MPTERKFELLERGKITYALLDLTEAEHAGYYSGMANRTLWPLFHYRIDLTSFEHEWYQAYRDVARLFAERLIELLQPEDRVWVQDFHLIPLGTELRRLGFAGRLGFFLHIPFPPTQLYATMPWHRELADRPVRLRRRRVPDPHRPRALRRLCLAASWAPSRSRAIGCGLASVRSRSMPARSASTSRRSSGWSPRPRGGASSRPSTAP